jgi:hypothetical protein
MKYIKEISLFEDAGTHKFGCAMLYFDLPPMSVLHGMIDEDDVYTDDSDRSYGLETEPHVTILYGLHGDDEVDDAEVIKACTDGLSGMESLRLCEASCFENDQYDVLKFDVRDCQSLYDTNAELAKMPHTNKFPDYHPHCTVGYLKPGCGQKYVDMLKGVEIIVSPEKIVYSKADGSKIEESCKK